MAKRAPAVLYCDLMEELKRRVELIQRFTSGSIAVGTEQHAYECVSVQLRKVLELIAFGSLCASKENYSKVHANFSKHWNAKALLSELEKVHPDFYPKPMLPPIAKPDGTKHLDNLKDGFLTKEEFVALYNACSKVIHTRNPFSEDEPRIDFVRSVDEWVQRVQALLKLHVMHLAGSSELWVVSMHEPSDGKVHAYIANPSP